MKRWSRATLEAVVGVGAGREDPPGGAAGGRPPSSFPQPDKGRAQGTWKLLEKRQPPCPGWGALRRQSRRGWGEPDGHRHGGGLRERRVRGQAYYVRYFFVTGKQHSAHCP